MFKIGEFSTIARVSDVTLRHYDDIGLFKPTHTDPETGYRYYSIQQLPRLNRILALRDLGLTLDQVARLMEAVIEDGLLYAVARGGHTIFTVTLTGDVRPFAGSGERGHDNGPAAQATFSFPNDIAASPDGQRFYVNEVAGVDDSANIPSVIRVIELPRAEDS